MSSLDALQNSDTKILEAKSVTWYQCIFSYCFKKVRSLKVDHGDPFEPNTKLLSCHGPSVRNQLHDQDLPGRTLQGIDGVTTLNQGVHCSATSIEHQATKSTIKAAASTSPNHKSECDPPTVHSQTKPAFPPPIERRVFSTHHGLKPPNAGAIVQAKIVMRRNAPRGINMGDFISGIATISLGSAYAHDIRSKLRACSEAGFKGIEMFYNDLATSGHAEVDAKETAQVVRGVCNELGLRVINLQPFRDYEGLISAQQHREKIEELKGWLALCKILGTDLIGVPSNFVADPSITSGDSTKIVQDLQEMADLGAEQSPPIRFAYEAMAWGPHVNTWQQTWDLVQQANRSNLGICLDTFQILAKTWADPRKADGTRPLPNKTLHHDLQELVSTIDCNKLYLIQAADAAKMDTPLSARHPWTTSDQHPLMTWSRRARLFPFEEDEGAYLPVMDVLKACILDLGYRGPISMEIFNDAVHDTDPSIPNTLSSRGMLAWRKCVEELEKEVKRSATEKRNGAQ